MNKLVAITILMLLTGCQQNQNSSKLDDCNGRLEKQIPTIPAKAVALKVEGMVVVSYIVGLDGHPKNIRIVSAVPKDMFEQETLKAVRSWCLKPTITPAKSTIAFRRHS
ncbi:TonB family protein [Leclercia adecarboxylata]|uniref:TonB family protein n=1 Tax=Leclercia adecarboxylata TaxID=83655 RepID=UPI001F447509|nr:TonB family protein [Leclercia adecarboxylata]MCE9979660.1 TonB family protein [Leclercia adecarboxylata]